MEAYKILQADVLDILFEGRNKAYGAYELRKTYNKRVVTAFLFTAALFATFYFSATIAAKLNKMTGPDTYQVREFTLENAVPLPEKQDQPVPPPPPKVQEPPRVEMRVFVEPKIVDDARVTEPPPAQVDLEHVRIGKIDQEGLVDIGIVTAAPVQGTTVVAPPAPQKQNYDDEVFSVQEEAKFPGGQAAWRKFLERNLNNMLPVDNGAPAGRYTVTVSFLVDKDGNITEVKAENDPGYGAAEEAVRVIKRSQKWNPAKQNDRCVIYRQRQAVIFEVNTEG